MKPLKIRAHGMFGATHSWSYTIRSIMMEFHKMGHQLYITSTDGYSFAPKELAPYFDKETDQADIDLCYTLPRNFQQWFNPKSKLKLAIFNWESTTLPPEWKACLKFADFVLPSSKAVMDVFLDNGWDKEKLITLPLGVDWEVFSKARPMDISGLNSFKFLNVSIPHHRKNLDILFDAYYSSFSSDDDVSLIIKSSLSQPKNKFECDLNEIIRRMQSRHSKKMLPKVHLIVEKLQDVASLYKTADCLVSASSFEGFGLPMLEAFASNLQVIAPRASGQLDFLNDDNSFLIGVDKIKAGEKYQYWRPDESSTTYLPRVDELSQSMLEVFGGKRKLFSESLKTEFSWNNSANNIINIYENIHK
jgi:glycosyltransferase involved in cell wall biosynthesis